MQKKRPTTEEALMQAAERARTGENLDSSMVEFSTALRDIVQVSKADMNALLAEEAARTAGRPKRGPKPKVRP